jgi:hypothetical protein
MLGPYATIGARLVERGYSAISIMPGTKRPGELRGAFWVGKSDWRKIYTDRLPTPFEIECWSESDAGVGVVCGPASRNLVGIDIDTDDERIKTAILSVLPGTALIKRGAKGATHFYRGALESSPSWNVDKQRVCDIIGPGRQTLLPPTIHPDTSKPYTWIGGVALEDTDPADIPELPADAITRIGEALRPFGWNAEANYGPIIVESGTGTTKTDPYRKLNNDGLANLHKWVPDLALSRCQRTRDGYEAVAWWRSSNTGQIIDKRKLNLKICPKGIVDFGDGPRGYTALDLAKAALDTDRDTAFKFLAERLWDTGLCRIGSESPSEAVQTLPPHDPMTGEIIEDNATVVPFPRQDGPLNRLTQNIPGMVGEIIDWVCASSQRPNRILALGTAITVIGTLIGRRCASPTRSATHLYVVGLAPTGAGKDYPRRVTKKLLESAGAAKHHGPGKFMSQSSIYALLTRSALCLCGMDEFGAFLTRVNGRKASTHEAAISEVLREIWGTSFAEITTPEWANKAYEVIHSPALTIFGMSTDSEFYESMNNIDVRNGFLNRLLVLQSDDRTEGVIEPKWPAYQVPCEIGNALAELYRWGEEMNLSRTNDSTFEAVPYCRAWESMDVAEAYQDFSNRILREMQADQAKECFLARVAETAIRLATIRSAGREGRDGTVDMDDMKWGMEVAELCANRMMQTASKYMTESLSHGQAYNRILQLLGKEQYKRMSRTQLTKAIGKAVKSSRDLDATLALMEEGGRIRVEKTIPPTGGRPTVWYVLAA